MPLTLKKLRGHIALPFTLFMSFSLIGNMTMFQKSVTDPCPNPSLSLAHANPSNGKTLSE